MTDYRTQQWPSECEKNPNLYRRCPSWVCLPRELPCPCSSQEFRCSKDICIPQSSVCDGRLDCDDGRDELCNNNENTADHIVGVPLPVFIGALAGCFLICVCLVILIFCFVKRKYSRRTGSNSSNEPLQPNSDSDVIKDIEKCKHCQLVEENEKEKPRTVTKEPLQNHGYQLINQDVPGFADELLCTSTPRQGVRHTIGSKRYSGNLKFSQPASLFVIRNNKKNNNVIKGDVASTRAIGDSFSNLNSSKFAPIT